MNPRRRAPKLQTAFLTERIGLFRREASVRAPHLPSSAVSARVPRTCVRSCTETQVGHQVRQGTCGVTNSAAYVNDVLATDVDAKCENSSLVIDVRESCELIFSLARSFKSARPTYVSDESEIIAAHNDR